MSHTVRGEKGGGYEYWSRRSEWSKSSRLGKVSKRYAKRKIRRGGKHLNDDERNTDGSENE